MVATYHHQHYQLHMLSPLRSISWFSVLSDSDTNKMMSPKLMFLFGVAIVSFMVALNGMITINYSYDVSSDRALFNAVWAPNDQIIIDERCALCFFGLPRSFGSLVLPSVIANILEPNMKHGCDIFVHYYDVQEEYAGRESKGGSIDNTAIESLQKNIQKIYEGRETVPDVIVVSDTQETFLDARFQYMRKYRREKASDGKYKYFPWKETTFVYPTSMDNMVKQWHSIESVWNAMINHGKAKMIMYSRVAMLRNDVVYVTPVDIYETSKQMYDKNNTEAVIPNFAKHPVNDRMIYGPFDAVRVWATERFLRIDQHANDHPGWGMHSERFMNNSIFPAIKDTTGFTIEESPHICFFRARADGHVHFEDCNQNRRFGSLASPLQKKQWVEDICKVDCTIQPMKRHDQIFCTPPK